MMNRNAKKNLVWLALLMVASIWIIASHKKSIPAYITERGTVFGTVYHITYRNSISLKDEIDGLLQRFDGSLSPFNDTAVITRVNRNEDVRVDTLFSRVFRKSMEISELTHGAFDITVAPLVNAYGFGFEEQRFPDTDMIDSLKQFVGFRKVRLSSDGKVVKDDSRLKLDCSAIAKGYAVDIVADYLRGQGIADFMVDIGGEVVVGGRNPEGDLWRIGVNKPVDDSLAVNQDLQTVLHLTGVGIATSGNYRNFYYKDGMKYAHTIDPRSGQPARHSLLSATVVASDCMTADAFATAFMVLGLDSASVLADGRDDIEAYFIYADSLGNIHTKSTTGMARYLGDR